MKKLLYVLQIAILASFEANVLAQTPSVTMTNNIAFYNGTTSTYSCEIDPSQVYWINGTYTPGKLWAGDGGVLSNDLYLINGRPAYKMRNALGGEGYKVFNGNCLYGGGDLMLWWNGYRWVLGYRGQTGPNTFDFNIALYNGVNTVAPPCEGWAGGGRLTGNCQPYTIQLTGPQGGPAVDTRKTRSGGVVNDKNAYEIPLYNNTGYVYIYWDGLKWIMKTILTPGSNGRIADEELSVNTGDNGANPPCTGWSNGYELGGGICEGGEAGIQLPVNLISFEANAGSGNVVRLNWSTAGEHNFEYFSVERSHDVKKFEELARIIAKGDSYEIKSYIHTDETPLRGRSFYRLRQVDLDGSHTYSPIVSVRTSSTDVPYPNPTSDGVIYMEVEENAILNLTDMDGRDIPFTKRSLNGKIAEIRPIRSLIPGIYIISHNGIGSRIVVE
ncbi:T9SS type A sorting domain-containing protein [Ravibacter arvi]